ncbi:MAG: HDIG domain-containing metalloprotein [Gemmatimonadota bacterium]
MAADRLGELLQALSRRPEHTWPDAVVHHGVRVALLVGLVLLMRVLFPVAPMPDFPLYERGDVPQEQIIAQERFTIPKSDADLARERGEAAAAVAPVFHYDPTALDSMLTSVRRFIAHADSAARTGATDIDRRDNLRDLLVAYGFPVSSTALDLLAVERNRTLLRQSLERLLRQELPEGVVSVSDFEESPSPQWRLVREGRESLLDRDSVQTQNDLYSLASRYLPTPAPEGLADFQRLVLIRFFEGSVRLDRERTETAREQARAAVPDIKGEVVAGERVIAAHEQIRDAELERLDAYRQHLQRIGALGEGMPRYKQEAGTFMLNLLVLSIFGFLLLFYRPDVYSDFRHVTLIAALVAVLFGAAAAVSRAATPAELVPIAFPVLVIAALWDGRMALNLALVLATLLSIQTPFLSMSSRMLILLGGSAAALSVRVVRRRAQGLVLGVAIAAAYAAAAIALGLMRSREAGDIFTGVMWGTANGMASALIAMGFLPLFEAYTRITTDQTLLELADLNRPLLKRLSLEATGTYAHSINVANLAEAAARAIDANALLVRVGAYYHDVGKIVMPQYFIENQARGRNPHEQIDPRKSAAIVRAHVEEGIKLAKQAKLPDSIVRFIPEHHGTQSIGFFYDQARQTNPEAELNAADFSYQGPRPQMKETAILMLADSVESAAKVLQEPSPDRIRSLVERIVEGKIEQRQLEETPLTMRELTLIKEQFASVLTGMYHHRLDYPAPRPGAAAPTATPPAEPAATRAPDSAG